MVEAATHAPDSGAREDPDETGPDAGETSAAENDTDLNQEATSAVTADPATDGN